MEINSETIRFFYDEKEYVMTAEEIEAAYRFREREYRLADAERQVSIFCFGVDDPDCLTAEESLKAKADFLRHYKISYEEAQKEDFLNLIIQNYEDRIDCNIDENSQWENAITYTLLSNCFK